MRRSSVRKDRRVINATSVVRGVTLSTINNNINNSNIRSIVLKSNPLPLPPSSGVVPFHHPRRITGSQQLPPSSTSPLFSSVRKTSASVWLVGRTHGPWQPGENATLHLGDPNHRVSATNSKGMEIYDTDSIEITAPRIHITGSVKINGNDVTTGGATSSMTNTTNTSSSLKHQSTGHLFAGGVLGNSQNTFSENTALGLIRGVRVVEERGEGGSTRPVVSPTVLGDVWPEAVTNTSGVVNMHGRLTGTLVPKGNDFMFCTSRLPLHPQPGDRVQLVAPNLGNLGVVVKSYPITSVGGDFIEVPIHIEPKPMVSRPLPVIVESWTSERIPHTDQSMLLAATIVAVQSLSSQLDNMKALNSELLKRVYTESQVRQDSLVVQAAPVQAPVQAVQAATSSESREPNEGISTTDRPTELHDHEETVGETGPVCPCPLSPGETTA